MDVQAVEPRPSQPKVVSSPSCHCLTSASTEGYAPRETLCPPCSAAVECGYWNQFTMGACAACGALRHDWNAELEARVSALLQTCDPRTTSARQLQRRLKLEGASLLGHGICITSAELQEEMDRQIWHRRELSECMRAS